MFLPVRQESMVGIGMGLPVFQTHRGRIIVGPVSQLKGILQTKGSSFY